MKKQAFFKLVAITLLSVFFTASLTQVTSARTPRPEPSEHVHPIPLIPIVVDGVKMSPEEISKYDGQPLYYLVNDQARSEGVVYIFTTLERLVNSEGFVQSSDKSGETMTHCQNASTFYTNTGFSGNSIGLIPGDETSLYGGGLSHLNDNIESVKTTSCNVYTILMDYIQGAGDQLWLACCGETDNLAVHGWANRASYLKVNH